jgi:hypothetical protein
MWEYLIKNHYVDRTQGFWGTTMQEDMNKLGQEGWEAFSTTRVVEEEKGKIRYVTHYKRWTGDV